MTTRKFIVRRGETVVLERAKSAPTNPPTNPPPPTPDSQPRGVLFTDDETGRYRRRPAFVTFEFFDLGTRLTPSGEYDFLPFTPYVDTPYPDTSPLHQEQVRWSGAADFLLQGDPFGSTAIGEAELPNCARLPEDSDYLFIDAYLYREGTIYLDDESTTEAVTVLGTGDKRPILWVAGDSTNILTGAPAPRSKSWTSKAVMKRAVGNRDVCEVDAWWYYNGLVLNVGQPQDAPFKLTSEPDIASEQVELKLKAGAKVRVYLTPRFNVFRVYYRVLPVIPTLASVIDRVRVLPDSAGARTALALDPRYDMGITLAVPQGELLETLKSYFAHLGAKFYGVQTYAHDGDRETRFPQLIACLVVGDKIYYFWELSGEGAYTIGEFFYVRGGNFG